MHLLHAFNPEWLRLPRDERELLIFPKTNVTSVIEKGLEWIKTMGNVDGCTGELGWGWSVTCVEEFTDDEGVRLSASHVGVSVCPSAAARPTVLAQVKRRAVLSILTGVPCAGQWPISGRNALEVPNRAGHVSSPELLWYLDIRGVRRNSGCVIGASGGKGGSRFVSGARIFRLDEAALLPEARVLGLPI